MIWVFPKEWCWQEPWDDDDDDDDDITISEMTLALLINIKKAFRHQDFNSNLYLAGVN